MRLRPYIRLIELPILAGALTVAAPAVAQVAEPKGRDSDAFDLMNLLGDRGLHDLLDESWNAYGQVTWISSFKLPFHALYTNAHGSNSSLVPSFEHSFTGSATLYLGVKLWQGGEAYYVPEVISERPLSGLKGLGGSIQNFELQKGGSEMPQLYRARAYVQQTIGLGGKRVEHESNPMQLGTTVDSRRLVLRAGNFSIIDFLDKNEFAGDLRQQFFNMAFLTYAAYDFGSDARGLAFGGVAELIWDDWSFRVGRVTPPQNPNELSVELRFWKLFGDQAEIERRYDVFGLKGAIRLLGYRNRVNAGRFDDAIAAFRSDPSAQNAAQCSGYNYGSTNLNAPDLCWVRRPNNKVGIGLNLEQHLSEDVGIAFRGMISDGKSEVFAYTPTDRSIALSVLARGTRWHRPYDLAGVGVAANWISDSHAEYLRMGGVDGFIGDGGLRKSAESVIDVFYSANIVRPIWLSIDFQHITNPAFNADRGPVEIIGGRAHAEF